MDRLAPPSLADELHHSEEDEDTSGTVDMDPKQRQVVSVISIEEDCFIVDRGYAVYIGELGHVFKPPVSIHIPRWSVMECPVQCNIEV